MLRVGSGTGCSGREPARVGNYTAV